MIIWNYRKSQLSSNYKEVVAMFGPLPPHRVVLKIKEVQYHYHIPSDLVVDS